MGLDRDCNEIYYLTGRYIALIELSNGCMFTGTQMELLVRKPAEMIVKYDRHRTRYDRERSEILNHISADGFPANTYEDGANTLWVGYYHQKSYLSRKGYAYEVVTTEHVAAPVAAINGNTIDELHND